MEVIKSYKLIILRVYINAESVTLLLTDPFMVLMFKKYFCGKRKK